MKLTRINQSSKFLGGILMRYFNNRILVSSANSAIRDVTIGTRFHFSNYGAIIRAKFFGENIINGELIGMVNQIGVLEAIFNYCNRDAQYYSGICSFKLENIHELHGVWALAGDETKENRLVLEEH